MKAMMISVDVDGRRLEMAAKYGKARDDKSPDLRHVTENFHVDW